MASTERKSIHLLRKEYEKDVPSVYFHRSFICSLHFVHQICFFKYTNKHMHRPSGGWPLALAHCTTPPPSLRTQCVYPCLRLWFALIFPSGHQYLDSCVACTTCRGTLCWRSVLLNAGFHHVPGYPFLVNSQRVPCMLLFMISHDVEPLPFCSYRHVACQSTKQDTCFLQVIQELFPSYMAARL